MWIHEQPDWPNLRFRAQDLTTLLGEVRSQQGRLLGRMEGLGFDLQQEAGLATLIEDITKSSAIEDEVLDRAAVRSSIGRRLGLHMGAPKASEKHVEGIVEVMMDATSKSDIPLTVQRLFSWHGALFPMGRSGLRTIKTAGWREADADPMQVVSGPLGHETVHFEAPSADRLEKEMVGFLWWFETDQGLDPVIKAGLAHFWFVTIHPFEDGNGRIARAIGDMALARADGQPHRYYSLSKQIEAERNQYYRQLERGQRGGVDVTDWLTWFLECLGRAIEAADETLQRVIYKDQIWELAGRGQVNDRQRLILNRMLEDGFEGYMTTSKYAKMAKCSGDSALRDITVLKNRGVFEQNESGGRSTSYRLATMASDS